MSDIFKDYSIFVKLLPITNLWAYELLDVPQNQRGFWQQDFYSTKSSIMILAWEYCAYVHVQVM